MNQEELQLLKENFLVEELEKLFIPSPLTKEAGLFEDLGGSSAAQWLKDQFQDSSEVPGGYFTSIVNLLAPAVAFRINPFLGFFYLAMSTLGYDISGIAVSVAKKLKPKIDAKEPITTEEIKSAVDASAGAAPDGSPGSESVTAEESFDYLIKQAYLVKYSYPSAQKTLVEKIFGNLFKTSYGKRKLFDIGKGLIFWMFKNIFLSLGLLAGAAAIFGPTKKKSLKDDETESTTEDKSSEEPSKSEEEKKEKSEDGESRKDIYWTIKLVNDSVRETLKSWALYYYPELNQYPDISYILYRDPKFLAVESKILSDRTRIGTRRGLDGKISVQMPQEYLVSSDVDQLARKVVDKFITREFLRKLNETKTQ